MISELKRLFVEQPLATDQLAHECQTYCPRRFASDALSSVAYATEAILIALIALVTMANLRGLKESGRIFAIPTYIFILITFPLIGVGLFKVATGQYEQAPLPATPHEIAGLQSISFFLLLRASAAGCTALTGVEAISGGRALWPVPHGGVCLTQPRQPPRRPALRSKADLHAVADHRQFSANERVSAGLEWP